MLINKRQKQKCLIDKHGNPIAVGMLSFTDELESRGYEVLNLSRRENVYLPFSVVQDNFEPIRNSELLWLRGEEFFTFLPWWYSKKLDCYFRVSEVKMREGFLTESCMVLTVFYNNERVAELKEFFNQNRLHEVNDKSIIEIVITDHRGQAEFQAHELDSPEICLETMYNDDFKPVYEHVIEKLNKAGKGVVLLHGLAGTGKTHLIKHLTTQVDKHFIFLPVQMIAQLTSPSFMPMLLRRPNSVLVLEDCENYIEDRQLGRSGSVVSSLLQITDGILSDILNLQVICTFNTDLTQVDAALLREGRLIAEYEFKELEEKKWAQLTNNQMVNGKRTLANAFNKLTLRNEQPEKRAIGF